MKSGGIKAITPIDGRYREKIGELENYFSEFALIKYRVFVEVEYFVALCEYPLPNLKKVSKAQLYQLRELCKKFNEKQALSIKQIEKKPITM